MALLIIKNYSSVSSYQESTVHDEVMTEVAGEKTIVSVDSLNPWEQAFLEKVDHQSTQWRFPVGDGQGNPPRGYYNAQGFQENAHLGDDWNGRGGGNSDLGDPVFTISTGWVRRAENAGPGWGNVVRVVHQIKKGDEVKYIESIYAHLDSMYVKAGAFVADSQQIGTIGNANGAYYAHLHLEVRKYAGLPLGVGYSTEHEFHYDPTEFILKSRK